MLVFLYGVVSATKTMQLLVQHFQALAANQRVFLLKPACDTRFGWATVGSRAPGVTPAEADQVVGEHEAIDVARAQECSLVLVDEGQFLSRAQVQQLWQLSLTREVRVYGLKTDYRAELFPASAALLAWADRVIELETQCAHCRAAKATQNLRVSVTPAPAPGTIEIGLDNFVGVCTGCFTRAGLEVRG